MNNKYFINYHFVEAFLFYFCGYNLVYYFLCFVIISEVIWVGDR